MIFVASDIQESGARRAPQNQGEQQRRHVPGSLPPDLV